MERRFYVYILASRRNGTLYIGKTNDLYARALAHKNNIIQGFTSKYGVHTLVYYEEYSTENEAFRRERAMKEWKRKWKLDLIEKSNPLWKDLFPAA